MEMKEALMEMRKKRRKQIRRKTSNLSTTPVGVNYISLVEVIFGLIIFKQN
jgi:hypothetical protein